MFELLVEVGAADRKGQLARGIAGCRLRRAAEEGDAARVRELLASGASLEGKPSDRPVLAIAAAAGRLVAAQADEGRPFTLYGCAYATLLLRFGSRVRDPEELARTLFRLGSDERGVLERGEDVLTETIKELAAKLRTKAPIVRLWWD